MDFRPAKVVARLVPLRILPSRSFLRQIQDVAPVFPRRQVSGLRFAAEQVGGKRGDRETPASALPRPLQLPARVDSCPPASQRNNQTPLEFSPQSRAS